MCSFYGFPTHYYKEQYPNVGSEDIARRVLSLLHAAGIRAKGVERGLDHGVWASFKCGMSSPVHCTVIMPAERDERTRHISVSNLHLYLRCDHVTNSDVLDSAFDPDDNPLNVPIVQVSLFNSEDPLQHYHLGEAVSALRDQGILIVVSGMAVHNLQDMRMTRGDPTPLPYAVTFDEALLKAVTAKPGDERKKALVELLKRPDARQAHPTFEHLLPIHVGAGAAGEDVGRRLWTLLEGSLSWAQFRFGDVDSLK